MRPTSAEAEWAMRAVVFDRIGGAVGSLVIEAIPARRGDPPNIRRLRIGGPAEAMELLNISVEQVAGGSISYPGIIARMPLEVREAVVKAVVRPRVSARRGVSGPTEPPTPPRARRA